MANSRKKEQCGKEKKSAPKSPQDKRFKEIITAVREGS